MRLNQPYAGHKAIERKDGPSTLIFSRQGLPHQERTDAQIADIARGGYILKDCAGTPDADHHSHWF